MVGRTLLGFVVACVLAGGSAEARELRAPRGEVVLTIEGAPVTNGDGVASFDMEMLDELPQHTIETTTPWYKQAVRFEGPSMADVLAEVGAAGRPVKAHAINDYDVGIPGEDADKGLILATRRDGQLMPVRDKGPIFAMYPFDQDSSLRSQAYYSRCIWQLERLRVQ